MSAEDGPSSGSVKKRIGMKEHRAAHRYKLTLPIVVHRIPTATEADILYGKTRDVSTDGVNFITEQRLAPEEEFDFSLVFPGESTQGANVFVTGRARVLRVTQEPEAVSRPVGVAAVIQKFYIVQPEGTGQ